MAFDDRRHRCKAIGCQLEIPVARLFCALHLNKLNDDLRKRAIAASGRSCPAADHVVSQAQAMIARKEGIFAP